MLKFRTVPSLLVLALAGASQGQVVQKKGGYLILVNYKKGKVYKQNVSMVAAGMKTGTNTQIVTKCLDVDKKGIATLEVSTPVAPGKPPIKRKSKVDRHGRPVGNQIDGFGGTFMWPDTPMKVGEAWNGNINMADTGQGSDKLLANYKLVGFKTIGGSKVAVINAYMDVTGQYDIAGTGTINVRVADGQLHSATFNMGMKQYSENGKPTVLKLTMTIRTSQ